MAGPVDLLERASKTMHGALSGVGSDQLDSPTPCTDFDVRTLVNHVVGGTYMFGTIAGGGQIEGHEPPDFTGGDFAGAYAQASQQAVSAYGADGVMTATHTFPFGDMPGALSFHILLAETLVHGWDLAQATGQTFEPDPEAVDHSYEGAKGNIGDDMRGPGKFFGPAVPVADDAPVFDRLLGYMGRDPSA